MKYRVSLYYDQIVREVYEVEAENEEEALEKATAGDGEFQYDKVVSGELVSDCGEVERIDLP